MTNSFLIADEAGKQAVIFDAPDHTVDRLLEEAGRRGWEIAGLWLTHGHFDHFADHTCVRKRFPGARILIHAADEAKAQHPEVQTRLFGLPLTIEPLKADAYVTDGQHLKIYVAAGAAAGRRGSKPRARASASRQAPSGKTSSQTAPDGSKAPRLAGPLAQATP